MFIGFPVIYLFEELLNAGNQMLSFTVLIFFCTLCCPLDSAADGGRITHPPTPSYVPVCDRHNDTEAVFSLCTSFSPSQLPFHQYTYVRTFINHTRLLQYAHCSSTVRNVSSNMSQQLLNQHTNYCTYIKHT